MRYRVTRPRTLTGPVKADYAYAVGDIVDDADAPEGHVERLSASGALEPVAQEPAQESDENPPAPPAKPSRGRAVDRES